MSRPLPSALTQRGFVAVEHALPVTARLDVGGLFAQTFRPEIEAAFQSRLQAAANPATPRPHAEA